MDREICVAERDASEGLEQAKATDSAAEEAKAYARALEQARQRMEAEVRTISEFRGKVKGSG